MGAEQYTPAPPWKSPSEIPEASPGTWSARVIGVTNIGRPVTTTYFRSEDGEGQWQPQGLLAGETLVCWTPMPFDIAAAPMGAALEFVPGQAGQGTRIVAQQERQKE